MAGAESLGLPLEASLSGLSGPDLCQDPPEGAALGVRSLDIARGGAISGPVGLRAPAWHACARCWWPEIAVRCLRLPRESAAGGLQVQRRVDGG